MDFSYPPEAEAFRAELRAWLEANLDARFRAAGAARGLASGPERIALLREWNARLAEAGYAAIHWPREYGGRGAGLIEQVVLVEEMHRAGGERCAEGALPAPNAARRRHLVAGLLGAGRGERSRSAPHARRARRRPLRGERPEDLELAR
jgi:alkylation response protein AidB-like acyl-CoA dehydrogenase